MVHPTIVFSMRRIAPVAVIITLLLLPIFHWRTEIHAKLEPIKEKVKEKWGFGQKQADPAQTGEPGPDDGIPPLFGTMLPSPGNDHRDEYLAFCVAVRDQALDLPEFLQHHYFHMNVTRFYIMDDGSKTPMSEFRHTFGVPEEVLTFIYFTEEERQGRMQEAIYNQCGFHLGVNHTWIAYFDADEFLDTPGDESIMDILEKLHTQDNVGALGVSWQMHTSAGRLTRPESVRAGFQECIWDGPNEKGEWSDNRHVKSIVRQDSFGGCNNAHDFNVKNRFTVGENGDGCATIRQPITRNRIALHHYAVKSRAEYEEKMSRWTGDNPKTWDFWNRVRDMPHVPCPEMARYVSGWS